MPKSPRGSSSSYSPSRVPRSAEGWPQATPQSARDQFKSLNATLLYCPRCRVATPTRERLLLVLPTGNLYEYLCVHCGSSTGSKTDSIDENVQIYVP